MSRLYFFSCDQLTVGFCSCIYRRGMKFVVDISYNFILFLALAKTYPPQGCQNIPGMQYCSRPPWKQRTRQLGGHSYIASLRRSAPAGGVTTYNTEDGPALDEISIETLLNDPSRGMNTNVSIFFNDQRRTYSSV